MDGTLTPRKMQYGKGATAGARQQHPPRQGLHAAVLAGPSARVRVHIVGMGRGQKLWRCGQLPYGPLQLLVLGVPTRRDGCVRGGSDRLSPLPVAEGRVFVWESAVPVSGAATVT